MWRYIQHLKTLFITLIGLFTLSMNAQVYPVVVNQSIAVPYYGKLGQYSTSTQEKLQLFLNLTDISIANRLVRLRLVIEGNGLLISSVNNVMGATPLYLTGGVSQRFTNIDLRPYFELQNLQGINFEQYQRLLPEGMYTFRWEVYDLFTNELLSNPNSGQSLIYITQNDPPLLNLPLKDEIVTASETPNILFQWTPRHNTATAVAYEFEIKELWDTQIDPQAAFLASPTYYTETTRATSLLYNLTKPQLIPGKTYAWRVRATSDIGFGETASFKNNGYSEIYHFSYNTQCDPVKFALAEVQEKRSAKISWLGDPSYQNYHLQYRKADQEDADWFEVYTQNTQSLIANLEYDTTYEYRVGATCMPLTQLNPQYTYGNLAQFTIPSQADSRNYACGLLPNIEISNQNTLKNLGVNESFTAGDFPVTVKQVNSNGDRFSGLGFVTVPYLEDTKIAVRFENIKINTDYQLIDGLVETTYDLEVKGIKDAIQEIEAVIQAITFVGDKVEQLSKEISGLFDSYKNAKTEEERANVRADMDTKIADLDTQVSTLLDLPNLSEEDQKAIEEVQHIDKMADTELSSNDIENYQKASQKKAEVLQEITKKYEQEVKQENLDNQKFIEILLALEALDGDQFLKCKLCDDNSNTQYNVLDGSGRFNLNFKGNDAIYRYFNCIIGNTVDGEITLLKEMVSSSNSTILSKNSKSIIDRFLQSNDELLLIKNNDDDWIKCTTELVFGTRFCEDYTFSETEEERLSFELSHCLDDTATQVANLEQITHFLLEAQATNAPSTLQFQNSDASVYELKNGVAHKIDDALSDDEILAGNFTHTDEIFRFYLNPQNQIQLTIGLSKSLKNQSAITRTTQSVNTQKLSTYLTNTSNQLFSEINYTELQQTPTQLNHNMDSEAFPDGKSISINSNEKLIRIAYEAYGITKSLVTNSTFEQKTYVDSSNAIVKIPGLGTGTIEATGTKLTDITSMCTMAYSLATNKQVQDELIQSFESIKQEVTNDPTKVFPILLETVVTSIIGVNEEELDELKNENTDAGRRIHLASFSGTSVVITVIVGDRILAKLPDIIQNVSVKLAKGKKVLSFTSTSNITKETVERFREKIKDLGDDADKFFDDFAQADETVRNLFLEKPELVESWKVLSDAGETNLVNRLDDIEYLDDYVKTSGKTHAEVKTAIDDAGGFGNWKSNVLDDTIQLGKRSDGSLANALDDASFPKSGDAVRQASGVNRNNKRLLDVGDPDIPNAVSDYTFTKNGQAFSKLSNESWGEFFTRLKSNGFNVFESHHVFPVDLFKKESFRKWFELEGVKHFDVNGSSSLDNLIMLEKKIVGNGGVHSRHDAYTSKIGDFFDQRWNELKTQNPSWTDAQIAQGLNSDAIDLSQKIKQSLLDNSVKSNVEVSKFWDTVDFNSL